MTSAVVTLPLVDPTHSRPFYVGVENSVFAQVVALVEQHDTSRMPLVIWGPSGAGKTFLAESLVSTWKQASRARASEGGTDASATPKALLSSGIEFARSYSDAVDTDSVKAFRQSFRKAGLLFFDNVQFLLGKPAAVREFCSLIDRALRADQLVICTCKESPAEFSDDHLAGRLSAGLSLPLALPSPPAQQALLAHLVQTKNLSLSVGLQELLLERLIDHGTTITARSLQAALNQLESTAQLTGSLLDEKLIDSAFPASTVETSIPLAKIVQFIARQWKVTVAELRSSSRRHTLVKARGAIALFARLLNGESLQNIGKALGNRDHSTIHHALEKVQQALDDDYLFRSFLSDKLHELQITYSLPRLVQLPCGKPVESMSAFVAPSPAFDTVSGALS